MSNITMSGHSKHICYLIWIAVNMTLPHKSWHIPRLTSPISIKRSLILLITHQDQIVREGTSFCPLISLTWFRSRSSCRREVWISSHAWETSAYDGQSRVHQESRVNPLGSERLGNQAMIADGTFSKPRNGVFGLEILCVIPSISRWTFFYLCQWDHTFCRCAQYPIEELFLCYLFISTTFNHHAQPHRTLVNWLSCYSI